jgi:hypothetical protein
MYLNFFRNRNALKLLQKYTSNFLLEEKLTETFTNIKMYLSFFRNRNTLMLLQRYKFKYVSSGREIY